MAPVGVLPILERCQAAVDHELPLVHEPVGDVRVVALARLLSGHPEAGVLVVPDEVRLLVTFHVGGAAEAAVAVAALVGPLWSRLRVLYDLRVSRGLGHAALPSGIGRVRGSRTRRRGRF